MLGRPAATSPSSVPTSSIFEDDDIPRDTTHTLNEPSALWKCFFVQAIKLNKISDAILLKIYQPWQNAAPGQNKRLATADVVIELDSDLSEFEAKVHPCLSWANGGERQNGTSANMVEYQRQGNVLHARQIHPVPTPRYCLTNAAHRFLHLKILLHRPFFTQFCNVDRDSPPPAASEPSALFSAISTQCALSCVGAALDLLKLIHENYRTTVTGAWWYNGLCECFR